MDVNTLYYGDCLDWMSRWNDNSVDLIYLDPPFNSKANYNILYNKESAGGAQYRAFSDIWAWDAAAGERLARFEAAVARPAHDIVAGLHRGLGECGMLAYLTYMAERLEHMKRLLKPTGSIYLHCDSTASHGLKLIMDAIFGQQNFRNEIAWCYRKWSIGAGQFARNHDVILLYSKSDAPTFNIQYVPVSAGTMKRWKGRKQQAVFKDGVRHGDSTSGNARSPCPDWWDISIINPNAKERLGYPTQKPLALLERIVRASSNEGDLVLDPFCGCGTTIDACRKLNRQWAGIDISAFAIDLIRDRRLNDASIPTKGIPADLIGARKLAKEQPFAFESWAITRLPGFAPNVKQQGDGGIDGRATLAMKPDDYDSRLALAQVKSGKFHSTQFRDFNHVIDRDHAAVGCYLTLDPVTGNARANAKRAGNIHISGNPYDRMNLWSIREYFDNLMPVLPIMTDPWTSKPLNQPSLF